MTARTLDLVDVLAVFPHWFFGFDPLGVFFSGFGAGVNFRHCFHFGVTRSAILVTRKTVLSHFGWLDVSVGVTAGHDVHFLTKRRNIKTVQNVFGLHHQRYRLALHQMQLGGLVAVGIGKYPTELFRGDENFLRVFTRRPHVEEAFGTDIEHPNQKDTRKDRPENFDRSIVRGAGLRIDHTTFTTVLDAEVHHHADDTDKKYERNPEDRHVQIVDLSGKRRSLLRKPVFGNKRIGSRSFRPRQRMVRNCGAIEADGFSSCA